MSTIEVAVAGRGIQVKQGYEKPSAGDVNTCQVSLAIESGGLWDSLPHKRVTFATRTASVTVDYAPTITIPHEVMASPGALYLTLTGYDADGIEVARTHRMTYPIEVAKAGADEGAEPTPATLDVVSRIDALAAELEEKRDTDYWRGEPGKDGAPGAPGEPGSDGYSPTANVTKNGGTATITITDKNGTTTATVSDGAPGSDANVTKENVEAALGYEPLKGLSIGGTEVAPVGGVVDVPISNATTPGVIITDNSDGGYSTGLISVNNRLYLKNAQTVEIANRSHRIPILANNMDYAVKAAMTDGKGASWTDDEQRAARERMNAADANKVYIMQKQIENLQGIAATEETDSTEAYTKTVPTGAQKWASLDKVGGKTVVNDGELVSAEVVEVESKGTFPIPQSVRDMCPGYGWSAGTVCNEIDFGRKVYVQRVGSVDLGTLTWETSKSVVGADGFFITDFATGITFNTRLKNAICSLYQQSSGKRIYEGTVDKAFAINDMYISSSAERIYVRDSAYTEVASFKVAMVGVLLYYELAEPIEVDLSDMLPDDHFIEVEAGGTVTFKQASTQLPVPSEITYQISTSEVIANA